MFDNNSVMAAHDHLATLDVRTESSALYDAVLALRMLTQQAMVNALAALMVREFPHVKQMWVLYNRDTQAVKHLDVLESIDGRAQVRTMSGDTVPVALLGAVSQLDAQVRHVGLPVRKLNELNVLSEVIFDMHDHGSTVQYVLGL